MLCTCAGQVIFRNTYCHLYCTATKLISGQKKTRCVRAHVSISVMKFCFFKHFIYYYKLSLRYLILCFMPPFTCGGRRQYMFGVSICLYVKFRPNKSYRFLWAGFIIMWYEDTLGTGSFPFLF